MSANLFSVPRPIGETDPLFDPGVAGNQVELESAGTKRRFSVTASEVERHLGIIPVFCDADGEPVPDGGTFDIQVVRVETSTKPATVGLFSGVEKVTNACVKTLSGFTNGTFDVRVTAVSPLGGGPTHYKLVVYSS